MLTSPGVTSRGGGLLHAATNSRLPASTPSRPSRAAVVVVTETPRVTDRPRGTRAGARVGTRIPQAILRAPPAAGSRPARLLAGRASPAYPGAVSSRHFVRPPAPSPPARS